MSYSNILQKRLPNVKVKSPEDSRHEVARFKRSVHFNKRTETRARNSTENFWEMWNEFLRSYHAIKGNERIEGVQKAENYVDMNQLVRIFNI